MAFGVHGNYHLSHGGVDLRLAGRLSPDGREAMLQLGLAVHLRQPGFLLSKLPKMRAH